MKKKKTAALITLKHRGGFRALEEMLPGSKYIETFTEIKERVYVQSATIDELKEAMVSIGLKVETLEDFDTVKQIAQKFDEELCKIPGGKLANDEDGNSGIYTFKLIDQ